MDLKSSRHRAFDAIDFILSSIDKGIITSYLQIQELEAFRDTGGLINEIFSKYDLFGVNQIGGGKWKLHLKMEGMRVLDLGGIREYLLDYDTAIQFYMGFPRVMSVFEGNELVEKFMLNSNDEFATLIHQYPEPNFRYSERTTRRNVIDKGMPPPIPPTSMQDYAKMFGRRLDQDIPPTPTNIHVQGNYNSIQGPVENIQQPVVTGNSNIVTTTQSADKAKEIAKSGFWKWVERYQWIVVILGTIILVIIGYLTWKAA